MTPITINSRGDPETKTIRVKRLIASNKEQLIIRCNIFLPYQRPAINKISYIKNLMHNHYVETISGRVLIKGNIIFEISYLSEKPNQPNRFFASTTYYDFIDVPEATTEMIADIKSIIDSVTLVGFDNDTRMITVDVVINNTAMVYDFEQITLITDLPSSYGGKFEKATINEIADVAKGCLKGSEEICIPLSKPPINRITKCTCMPMLQNYDVNLGSVTVYGWFNLTITYLDNHDQKQCIERFIPFSKILAAPNAQKHLMSEAFITSHQAECSLLSDRSLLLKHTTFFTACVFESTTFRVLTESNSLNTKKETFTCESLADIQSIETLIRVSSEINQDIVSTEIKDLRVGPVNFLVKQLINNKVLVRGYVDFLVGYMETKTADIKYLYRMGFFKAVAEVSNVTADDRVELTPVVNFTRARFSKDKLTISALLNIIVKVSNLKQIIFVKDINCPNSKVSEDQISFTYVMQPDDEIKTLAVRFGTTVEAIDKLNPQLTQPYENKKIQIPCQVKKI